MAAGIVGRRGLVIQVHHRKQSNNTTYKLVPYKPLLLLQEQITQGSTSVKKVGVVYVYRGFGLQTNDFGLF